MLAIRRQERERERVCTGSERHVDAPRALSHGTVGVAFLDALPAPAVGSICRSRHDVGRGGEIELGATNAAPRPHQLQLYKYKYDLFVSRPCRQARQSRWRPPREPMRTP